MPLAAVDARGSGDSVVLRGLPENRCDFSVAAAQQKFTIRSKPHNILRLCVSQESSSACAIWTPADEPHEVKGGGGVSLRSPCDESHESIGP